MWLSELIKSLECMRIEFEALLGEAVFYSCLRIKLSFLDCQNCETEEVFQEVLTF